jgi:hypothetical protein
MPRIFDNIDQKHFAVAGKPIEGGKWPDDSENCYISLKVGGL